MLKVPRLLALLVAACTLLPINARAFELSGAWASQEDLCNRVFVKKGDRVVFAELSDLFGSGFVIDGNRIRGRTTRCTIQSQKQDGDSIMLSAACASSIMRQAVRFDLKVIDDNTIDRLFTESPGMSLKYVRCKL